MTIVEAIAGFLLDLQLRGRSPATIRLYRSCLTVLGRWLESKEVVGISGVTVHLLREFMVETQTRPAGSINPRRPPAADSHTVTAATQQSYVKAIKVFFGWLVEEGVIDVNPALRLPKPATAKRIVRTLTPDQVRALLNACDCTTSLGYRDFMIIVILLDTGIRVSELCGLTLDDVYTDHLKVFGKGKKEREVGVSPDAAKYLWKYIHQHRLTADDGVTALFTNFAGKPLQPSGVEKMLHRLRDAAGLLDVPITAHKFRHTFARSWLEHGGEVMNLSRLMGHSSVKITEIYLEDFQSRQARTQHTKYSPLSQFRVPIPGSGHHRYRRPRSEGQADTHPGNDGN